MEADLASINIRNVPVNIYGGGKLKNVQYGEYDYLGVNGKEQITMWKVALS